MLCLAPSLHRGYLQYPGLHRESEFLQAQSPVRRSWMHYNHSKSNNKMKYKWREKETKTFGCRIAYGHMLTFIVCLEARDIMASLLKRGQSFYHALLLSPLLFSIHHVLQVLHLPLPGFLITISTSQVNNSYSTENLSVQPPKLMLGVHEVALVFKDLICIFASVWGCGRRAGGRSFQKNQNFKFSRLTSHFLELFQTTAVLTNMPVYK